MALETSLLANYDFEGNSNDNKGTNNGTDSNIVYSSGNGFYLQGAGFNGSSSKILLADVAYGFTNGVTFNGWVKSSTTGVIQAILARDASTAFPRDYRWQIAANNKFEFVRFGSTNNFIEVIDSTSNANDGNWHMVTSTFDTTNGSVIYFDGVSQGTSANTTANHDATGIPLAFGADLTTGSGLYTDWFNGTMDEVSLWTRAITASEVTQLFNSGFGMHFNGTIFVPNKIASSNFLSFFV